MSQPSQLPSANETQGTLLLVGSSVRAAAQDAARAGWQIVAVDRFGDLDLTQFCNQWFDYNDTNWLDRLKNLTAKALVGVGGFERTGEVEIFCKEHALPIAYADPVTIRSVNDPFQLAAFASTAGIAFPETWHRIDTDSPLISVLDEAPFHPVPPHVYLLKPIVHAGGLGIRFASLQDHDPIASVSWDHWLQRYCRGTAIGASYIACSGKPHHALQVHLLGACESLIETNHATDPFIYQGSVGPISLSQDLHQRLQHVGVSAANRFGLRGLFNIDFVLENRQLFLLEINPRYSASMELLGTEQSAKPWPLIDWHVRAHQDDACLNDELAATMNRVCHQHAVAGCKRVVYALSDCRFDLQVAQASIQQSMHSITADQPLLSLSLADIPADRTISSLMIPAGQPMCTLFVRGARDANSAIRVADDAAIQLQASLKTL